MTELTFRQGRLRGRITVPGDKSISHRALILGSLSPHPIQVRNLNPGRDVHATKLALERINTADALIDCMNSGSTARMMMGVVTGANLRATFDGDDSLRRRPMEPVAAHLRAYGARIETNDGLLPVTVQGTDRPQTRRFILVKPSAQIKTALLLAATFGNTPITIFGDRGSRDHTERLLHYFGAGIVFDRSKIELHSMPSKFGDVDVPGDFSAAAFFIVAATVSPGSALTIAGVGVNPTRTGLLDALRQMGANIRLENERERCGEPIADVVVESASLRGIPVGAEVALRAIDEIPVLAVAAAFAQGETRITGVRELRAKESDRIAAIERLLRAAGIGVEMLPDGFVIAGGTPRTNGTVVETQGDHRTAMAAAALAAGAGTLTIDEGSSVAVSFPEFHATLEVAQR
jgi:3-phosphoshikimate 1-carboxyvinyltransferase